MTGENELTLNTATMIEAIQYWLKHTQFRDGACPRVDNVKAASNTYTGAEFVVILAEQEPTT